MTKFPCFTKHHTSLSYFLSVLYYDLSSPYIDTQVIISKLIVWVIIIVSYHSFITYGRTCDIFEYIQHILLYQTYICISIFTVIIMHLYICMDKMTEFVISLIFCDFCYIYFFQGHLLHESKPKFRQKNEGIPHVYNTQFYCC